MSKHIYTGKIFEHDKIDSNGVSYSKESVKRAIDDFEDKLKCYPVVYGEIRDEWDRGRYDTMLSKVSHIITDLEEKDDGYYVTIEVLPSTKNGKILCEMLDNGIEPIIEPRSFTYKNDYKKIMTFDVTGIKHRYENEFCEDQYEVWDEEPKSNDIEELLNGEFL